MFAFIVLAELWMKISFDKSDFSPSTVNVVEHFTSAMHLFWKAVFLVVFFFKLWALGGKPLDGSPEVWRSALREATIEIKACSPPTGPCPLQPEIHLHVVTGFWDDSASLTSKSLYTRLWHGEPVIVAMFPLHVWRIWSQLYKNLLEGSVYLEHFHWPASSE